MGHMLQPGHFLILLSVFGLLLLVPGIIYLITLQKALDKCAPTTRTMQPGMVWLLLIPLFNVIWHFFVVLGIAKSLANEFARRGMPSSEAEPGRSIGLAMCTLACCGLIPVLGVLASLAAFVLWIMYWVKVAGYSQALDQPQAAVAMPPLRP